MRNDWSSPALHPLGLELLKTTEPDLLDDLLAALRVDSSALFVFDFREPWGVEIDNLSISISWTVMEGTLWMLSPGAEPIEFRQGDTFLLPRGTGRNSYVLGSSADVKPVLGQDLWRQAQLQEFAPGCRVNAAQHVCWGGEGSLTRVVSAAFGFNDRQLGPIVDALPELMVVRAAKNEAEFIDILLRFTLSDEDAERRGFSVLATQMAKLLLVHVIRKYALSVDNNTVGWLAGLGDPPIARALSSIHREPALRWSVAVLARAAGLSRSVFAERFVARVGQTPMQYLRAWRMHLAREALSSGRTTVTELARDLGYQSEAAFRATFRRVTGQPPREFRRHAGKGTGASA